jgi:hypothetical protein
MGKVFVAYDLLTRKLTTRNFSRDSLSSLSPGAGSVIPVPRQAAAPLASLSSKERTFVNKLIGLRRLADQGDVRARRIVGAVFALRVFAPRALAPASNKFKEPAKL